MQATKLEIPEVMVLEPKVFEDDRGCFFESFNAREFRRLTGVDVFFAQDNHSISSKNVLRGLHFQIAPQAQGKLVRVVAGEIFDVAVDIRRNSATCGKWVSQVLSADNHKQLWIPAGFAHGFVVTSIYAEVLYKATEYYSPGAERSIYWDDPDLNINWPVKNPILSPKDRGGMTCLSWKQYMSER